MKRLKIFNTQTKLKEDFIPFIEEWKKDFVGFYSCWPTVYWDPTIGNYRAAFTADIIRNVLKNILGYKTISVMNITDVWHIVWDADSGEDKLEKWSKREWISAFEVAKKYEKIFVDWRIKLNIEDFDYLPRATEFIQEQIDLVKILEDKWYTYIIPWDWIYMDTSKIDDYGKITWPSYKKNIEWLRAWARVEMLEWKRNLTDFALRKFSPQDEKRQMEWDSPWWMWFPGWHIECSAMSRKYLGDQFDIHHGWEDHIAIHHPNEVAQSEIALDVKPWVKYWVHNKFLLVDGKRMGKSEWNAYTIADIEERWFNWMDLRYFYLTAIFNSYQDFTWKTLEYCKNSRLSMIKRIMNIMRRTNFQMQKYEAKNCEDFENKYLKSAYGKKFFWEVVDFVLDNLNTPSALATMNRFWEIIEDIDDYLNIVFYLDQQLFKLDISKSITEELEKLLVTIPEEITSLAQKRLEAKLEKNYAEADRLRKEIETKWFLIKDTTDWFEVVKG